MMYDTQVKCPYCGAKQFITVDTEKAREIHYCDIESVQGCLRPFVTNSVVRVATTIYSVSLEPVGRTQ